MKYYIKQGVFPFIYIIFMSITALGITVIEDLVWLKIILAIVNIGLYALIVVAVSFKEGQESIKVQHANDLERRQIIMTGENRPLKIHEEYKPWKGFVFGFVACVPLLFLLLLHTVIYLVTGTYIGVGAIAAIIYFMFFIFFSFGHISGDGTTTFSWYSYFGTLIALPVIMVLTGIAYNLGAKKIQNQRKIIEEKQREIYGDKV